MEISGKVPPTRIDAYLNNIKGQNRVAGSSSRTSKPTLNEDKVELSKNVKDVKEARAQLVAIPDVREEKVAEIKNQLENGTYQVDGKKVAFKLMRQSLIDEII